jgi:hypothetical protein
MYVVFAWPKYGCYEAKLPEIAHVSSSIGPHPQRSQGHKQSIGPHPHLSLTKITRSQAIQKLAETHYVVFLNHKQRTRTAIIFIHSP